MGILVIFLFLKSYFILLLAPILLFPVCVFKWLDYGLKSYLWFYCCWFIEFCLLIGLKRSLFLLRKAACWVNCYPLWLILVLDGDTITFRLTSSASAAASVWAGLWWIEEMWCRSDRIIGVMKLYLFPPWTPFPEYWLRGTTTLLLLLSTIGYLVEYVEALTSWVCPIELSKDCIFRVIFFAVFYNSALFKISLSVSWFYPMITGSSYGKKSCLFKSSLILLLGPPKEP